MVTITMKAAIGGESTSGRRCLLCAEVIDSVIAANGKCHQEPMSSLPILVFLNAFGSQPSTDL